MSEPLLSVAVPWSLTHYISLNGFHPLYRSLFQAKPPWLQLNAWDNIEFSQRLRADEGFRAGLLAEVAADQAAHPASRDLRVAKTYDAHFWTPNRTLTRLLPGDIEFHHTAPFPSLERPFVFHCEAFAPVFLPFAQQGGGRLNAAQRLREHNRAIFEHPLCLGVFSHLPQTLKDLSLFFRSPIIDAKLFPSRIGLHAEAGGFPDPAKGPLCAPVFLFVNSANQNPGNFFLRGGHLALRFWRQRFPEPGAARLVLRCLRPDDELLREHGVDVEWLRSVERRSVIWIESYLRDAEITALMQAAHFFLLPSNSLHSVSIMQAMAFGAVPVVSDTMGTDRYVEDKVDGLVVKGVRANNWRQDPDTGVLTDSFRRNPALEEDLARQLHTRIGELLSRPEAYLALQARAVAKARVEFSGQSFSDDFWQRVRQLRAALPETPRATRPQGGGLDVSACLLEPREWTRVFTSAPQPVPKLDAGRGRVTEMGGCFIATPGGLGINLHHWSPVAEYVDPEAPPLLFAADVKGLGGKYLGCAIHEPWSRARRVIEVVAACLKPYPRVFAFAAASLRLSRRVRKAFFPRRVPHAPAHRGVADIELAKQGVRGLNVIRCGNRFYAIPQSGGEFSEARAKAGQYEKCIVGVSLKEVLRKIELEPDLVEVPKIELIETDVQGFNIILCDETYYAILASEGAFDLRRVEAGGYSRIHVGASAEQVRTAILESNA